MERTLINRQLQTGPFLRPIELGGTGAPDPLNAVINLGGIHRSVLDMPNGIASLDDQSKIDGDLLPSMSSITAPALDGPKIVYVSSGTKNYKITNFDSKTVYNVSCNKGSVSFNSTTGTVNFTPPSLDGIAIITVNGTNFPIDVRPPDVIQSIVYPTNNSSGVSKLPTLISNLELFGLLDVTYTVQWQIARDNNFTDIVFDENVSNNQIRCSHLSPNTYYYMRIRTRTTSAINELGNTILFNRDLGWSAPFHFTTTPIAYPLVEVAILQNPEITGNINEGFGQTIALSPDGTLMFIACPGMTGESSGPLGRIYVYKLLQGIWENITYFNVSSQLSSGSNVDVSSLVAFNDGTCIVGCSNARDTTDNFIAGQILRYKLTGNQIAFVDRIESINPIDGGLFGQYIVATPDGLTLAVSQADTNYNFSVSIYKQNNQVYTLEDTINNPDLTNTTTNFGNGTGSFSLSNDGNRLAVCDNTGNPNNAGCVYIFDNDGTNWSLTTTLYPDQNTVQEYFGWPLLFSPDGNTLVCGNYRDDDTSLKLYFFELNNSNWVKTQVILPPDWNGIQFTGQASQFYFNADGTYLLVASQWQTATMDLYLQNGNWDASGAAYLYHKSGNQWTEVQKYVASDAINGIYFSESIAMSPDASEIIISAPVDNLSHTSSVYIFR